MSRKRFVALGSGIVAVIAVALVVLNVGTPAGMVAGPHDSMRTSLGVKLVIQVHHADGSTQTYVKEGDLVMKNFANLLINMMIMGTQDPDGDYTFVNTAGSSTYAVDFNEGTTAVIAIGNGTTTPTLNDYNLSSEVVSFPVQDADIIINGNNMTIDIFGSYVVNNAVNVTEVGLATLLTNAGRVLLFHDVLPSPIQLNAGDGITIHYYINIYNG